MTCRYQGSSNFPYTNTALYNVNVGTLGSASNIDTTNNASIGVTTDASKSGMACSITIPAKSTSSSSLSTLKLGKYCIKYQ